MIVPKGYIAFEEAGRELASSYVYADDTQPNGQDFDDGAWCDELWKVAEQLQIKGATGIGIILDIPADDRRETASRGWYGVHAGYTPFENEWLDLADGRIIAGDFKGCMIVIPRAAWTAYIKHRAKRAPKTTGGRPMHITFDWYKARNFDRGTMSVKQLQQKMREAFNGKAAHANTILAWEKKYQQKPPTKNP